MLNKCIMKLFLNNTNRIGKTWAILSTYYKKNQLILYQIQWLSKVMTVVIGRLLLKSLIIFSPLLESGMDILIQKEIVTFVTTWHIKPTFLFSFCQIDNTAIIRIINNRKISQSKGHNGISSELVKLINNDISHCITLIINQSLTPGIFPDRLKIAKVTPIYKKGCKKVSLITDPFLFCQ